MTREQLRMVVDDDVAVRALLLLGQPMPTWNEWLRLNNQVAKFMSGKY